MSDKQVYKGMVVWFSSKLGYGFIKKEDGSGDIFAHFSNIVNEGFKTLEANQKVEYEIGSNHKGYQAVAIKILDK